MNTLPSPPILPQPLPLTMAVAPQQGSRKLDLPITGPGAAGNVIVLDTEAGCPWEAACGSWEARGISECRLECKGCELLSELGADGGERKSWT